MGTLLVMGGLVVAGVLGCIVVNLPAISNWMELLIHDNARTHP